MLQRTLNATRFETAKTDTVAELKSGSCNWVTTKRDIEMLFARFVFVVSLLALSGCYEAQVKVFSKDSTFDPGEAMIRFWEADEQPIFDDCEDGTRTQRLSVMVWRPKDRAYQAQKLECGKLSADEPHLYELVPLRDDIYLVQMTEPSRAWVAYAFVRARADGFDWVGPVTSINTSTGEAVGLSESETVALGEEHDVVVTRTVSGIQRLTGSVEAIRAFLFAHKRYEFEVEKAYQRYRP